MATGTVKLHRVFKAPAERVYRAFLDPDALVKWMAPHGFTAKVHSFDASRGLIQNELYQFLNRVNTFIWRYLC